MTILGRTAIQTDRVRSPLQFLSALRTKYISPVVGLQRLLFVASLLETRFLLIETMDAGSRYSTTATCFHLPPAGNTKFQKPTPRIGTRPATGT